MALRGELIALEGFEGAGISNGAVFSVVGADDEGKRPFYAERAAFSGSGGAVCGKRRVSRGGRPLSVGAGLL